MAQVISTEDPSTDVRRFLRHWAAESFVDDRLREQHQGMGTDKRRTKARQVARLIHQGLDFLADATSAGTNTKPLALFYGAENLVKAACLCRDAKLGADDIRLHGLGGEYQTKRYSVKNLACRIKPPGKDVWSIVWGLFNCDRHRFQVINEKSEQSVSDYNWRYATPPLAAKSELFFGDLIRHLPDLANDVELAGWGTPWTVRADGLRTTKVNPVGQDTIRFDLRHGYRNSVIEMIDACESGPLRELTREKETLDVYEYSGKVPLKMAPIRSDVFGGQFLDLSPNKRQMGEIPIYLAALFTLSDVVRYQAEHWLRLLHDHPAEEIVVERFLDIACRKFPNLILNELNNEIYEFKVAR
jgi:YaaC-like Protein